MRQDLELGRLLRSKLGGGGCELDSDDDLTVVQAAAKYPHPRMDCGRPFKSLKELGHHRRYHHQVPAAARLYAVGSCCPCCGTEFHSRARLVKHFSRCNRCLEACTRSCEPIGPEALAVLEDADAQQRRASRKSGCKPLAAAFMPTFRSFAWGDAFVRDRRP